VPADVLATCWDDQERYKDETLELGDAGEKVNASHEHLISLGITKGTPVELLADDFIEQLNRHAAGNMEAKAERRWSMALGSIARSTSMKTCILSITIAEAGALDSNSIAKTGML